MAGETRSERPVFCDQPPFRFGTVTKWPQISQSSAYRETALNTFNSFTPERIFKAALIHPKEGLFHWQDADDFVAFCEKHQKQIHGHTLIWDRDLPEWLSDPALKNPVLAEQHAGAIVSRFKSRVKAWDVVNEAFNSEGQLRQGAWWRASGDSYIEKAFRAAHEADPRAMLFYNDFDLEVNSVKRRAVISFLDDLRKKGVRIDGIGFQLHLHLHHSDPEAFAAALKDVADAGFSIHLSELDVSVLPAPGEFPGKEILLKRQAELYVRIFESFLAIREGLRYGITLWGVGDADSWIVTELKKVDYPLLFDENYVPKPAFYSLMPLIRSGGS